MILGDNSWNIHTVVHKISLTVANMVSGFGLVEQTGGVFP